MASITFTIGALTKTFTVSAGDTTRIVSALTKNYGQVSNGAGGLRDMTNAEVFDVWSNSTMLALKDSVKRIEGDAAASTARAAVVDVVAT